MPDWHHCRIDRTIRTDRKQGPKLIPELSLFRKTGPPKEFSSEFLSELLKIWDNLDPGF